MAEVYQEYVEDISQPQMSTQSTTTGGGIYDWAAANIDASSVYKIKDFGAGTDYRLMSSFASGNVCSPTAGANIMWYWHKRIGGKDVLKMFLAENKSTTKAQQQEIFDRLKDSFGTDKTTWVNRATAFYTTELPQKAQYLTTTLRASTKEIFKGASFDQYDQAFRDNCPVHLNLQADSDGHAVMGFGTATSVGGTKYLFVMDGWNDYGRFVKFSNYYKSISGMKIWIGKR